MWVWENLENGTFTDERVIEIELLLRDAVPKIVVRNAFPSHRSLPFGQVRGKIIRASVERV